MSQEIAVRKDRLQDLEERADAALDLAQNALQRVAAAEDDLCEAERTIIELQNQLAELQATRPDRDREYNTLNREEKISIIQEELVERAKVRQNGKASIDYNDVKALFSKEYGGCPSPGHTYDLIEDAAEQDGFSYDNAKRGQYQLVVDLETLHESVRKGSAVFSLANKANTEGGV